MDECSRGGLYLREQGSSLDERVGHTWHNQETEQSYRNRDDTVNDEKPYRTYMSAYGQGARLKYIHFHPASPYTPFNPLYAPWERSLGKEQCLRGDGVLSAGNH